MAALPSYDDNHPDAIGPNVSTFNRSTQSSYPPGSTFKVVTATAAIDSGKYSPSSVVNGKSPVTISGVPLTNDGNQSYGPIDLTTALTFSVNTVWPKWPRLWVADDDGLHRRFGFYAKPPLDYPPDELNASQPVSGSPGARSRRVARTRTSVGSGSDRRARVTRCRWRWSPRRSPIVARC